MFGLLLTVCGSVLLAVMVAIRRRKEINDLIQVVLPIAGQVSPKVRDILLETYYFRIGLFYIASGAIFQIFPEFDLPIASLNIFIRLAITISGFIIILYVSRYAIVRIADENFKNYHPFDPNNSPPDGALKIDIDQ